jgi:tRNA (guanine6-N2)-methyltransferase
MSAWGGPPYGSSKHLAVGSESNEAHQGRELSAIRSGPNVFVAQTQPGFEAIAQDELVALTEGFRALGRRVVPRRNGLLVFVAPGVASFKRLRTVEDLFALVGYQRAADLSAALELARNVARATPLVASALNARAQIERWSIGKHGYSFRVVARIVGHTHFPRSGLKHAVERGVLARTDHRWRLADEHDDAIEFWATLIGRELFLALRLSNRELRHRSYQLSHRPAALRPAIAAAMAWLSKPRPQDIMFDPLCGTGTILIERAHLARHKLLLGADNDPQAIEATRINFGPRHKPWQLMRADAGALPLRDRSVDKIVTNLPWGKKFSDHALNQQLYPRLLAEFKRVTKRDGLIVILSSETKLMAQLISKMQFERARSLPVQILGARATVHVLRLPRSPAS